MNSYSAVNSLPASHVEIYSYFSEHLARLFASDVRQASERHIHGFPSTNSQAPFYESYSAYQTLAAIELLGDGWDGYGAEGFSLSVLSNAKVAVSALLTITRLPDITPNPNGTVSFEWETQNGTAHLEIGDNRYAFYLMKNTGEKFIHDGFCEGADFSSIGKCVDMNLFARIILSPTMTNARITRIAA